MAFDLQQKVFRLPDTIALSIGLQWDFIGADPVDLDLSAVCFTSEGMFIDCVFFNHPFPTNTDEEALRHSNLLVDPQQLPYMFISGDSRIGGEEENQLPGLALSARRRECQMKNSNFNNYKNNELKRVGIMDAIFSRLYEETELDGVEKAFNNDENSAHMRCVKKSRGFYDETITFIMHKIPSNVDIIFLVVTSYTGADFTILPNVNLFIINETTNEQVGIINLKHSTGNGTANLSCMLCRLQMIDLNISTEQYQQQLWDLRELNIRTFGYTFVDMLPLMLDVIGIDENSRQDAIRKLPNYSLQKKQKLVSLFSPHYNNENKNNNNQILSDIRFGVGWDGEHDIDAFMIMLDEQNYYVDHLHPKQSKLRSIYPHVACHSGDAINGFGTNGDEEFIDLMTYRLPFNVHTILFGASYVESFGNSVNLVESIFDIPKLYLRLQNRTTERPNSFEVDRWNIHYELEKYKKKLKKKKEKEEEEEEENSICRTYVDSDGKTHFVYMVILGAMIKKGEVPFLQLYPEGRLDQQKFIQHQIDYDLSTIRNGNVPYFEYSPLHEFIPIDKKNSLASAMPYLHGIVKYRCHGGNMNNNINNAYAYVDNSNNNNNEQSLVHSILPSLWRNPMTLKSIMTFYAIKVQFIEVRNLQKTLPHRFKCHGEAWVCGEGTYTQGMMGPYDVPPFRTPYLIHRDKTMWDEKNTAATALFFVRKFDRIRVIIYEYAAFGYVDIDLIQLEELWVEGTETMINNESNNNNNNMFRGLKRWFPLKSNIHNEGELCLRIFRVPTKEALHVHKKLIEKKNKECKRLIKQKNEQKEKTIRERYSCNVM